MSNVWGCIIRSFYELHFLTIPKLLPASKYSITEAKYINDSFSIIYCFNKQFEWDLAFPLTLTPFQLPDVSNSSKCKC